MEKGKGFAAARQVISEGIAEGLHSGAQLYVSLRGEMLIDAAFGEARDGIPMTPDSLTLWFSAGKPLTAVAIGRLVERDQLSWDTHVAEVIPEFAQRGKDAITVRHILTHTAGLHVADKVESGPWAERLKAIYEAALPEGWVPGTRGAYSATAGWYVLGELVNRLTGIYISKYVLEQIAAPAGMRDTSLCLCEERLRKENPRLAAIYDTRTQTPKLLDFWLSAAGDDACIPGGSARGPVRELARLYEVLLKGGESILSPATINEMTARQRTAIFDETFQYALDCGLCFLLNSNRSGMQMPYGYGRDASPGTFGHSGNQSSCAFADPERGLVAAWACNGMPGERRHQQRQRAINNAIFEELA